MVDKKEDNSEESSEGMEEIAYPPGVVAGARALGYEPPKYSSTPKKKNAATRRKKKGGAPRKSLESPKEELNRKFIPAYLGIEATKEAVDMAEGLEAIRRKDELKIGLKFRNEIRPMSFGLFLEYAWSRPDSERVLDLRRSEFENWMAQVIRDGDSQSIRDLADVLDRMENPKTDYIRLAVVLAYGALGKEIPTIEKLEEMVASRAEKLKGEKVPFTRQILRRIAKEYGFTIASSREGKTG